MADHVCHVCGKSLSSTSVLNRHLKDVHNVLKQVQVKNFKCDKCDKGFICKSTLTRHCIATHPESTPATFTCPMCNVSFMRPRELYEHRKNVHDLRTDANGTECSICGKEFSSASKRKRHQETVHLVKEETETLSLVCPLCDDQFSCTKDANDHLTQCHGITLEVETLQFQSFQDFESWKESMEQEKLSHYIMRSGKKKVAEGIRRYYQCHRSGSSRQSQAAKTIHGNKSVKIEGYCPSSLTMTESADGQVKVMFVTTHVGHTVSLKYLRLSGAQRAMLAGRIQAHVPLEQISKDIRDSVSEETGITRLHVKVRDKAEKNVDDEMKVIVEQCETSPKTSNLAHTVSELTKVYSLLDTCRGIVQTVSPAHMSLVVEQSDRLLKFVQDLAGKNEEATQTQAKAPVTPANKKIAQQRFKSTVKRSGTKVQRRFVKCMK